MAININTIKSNGLRAIGNRVLVTDMHFGEQTTQSGLIISSDDGTERGIYPRWAKVLHKGPENNDTYDIGHWILIEHGRWTRGMNIEVEGEQLEVRMVETESVLAYANEKPDGLTIGATSEHGTVKDMPTFNGVI
jgi:co-chaperonin GroES (HSP10)|tara:strand:- start:321 stop:725 length:405 start_codon:yes stop_codon:yes gene_type:complete